MVKIGDGVEELLGWYASSTFNLRGCSDGKHFPPSTWGVAQMVSIFHLNLTL